MIFRLQFREKRSYRLKTVPVTEEDLRKQLQKTGGTPFELELDKIYLDGAGFFANGRH